MIRQEEYVFHDATYCFPSFKSYGKDLRRARVKFRALLHLDVWRLKQHIHIENSSTYIVVAVGTNSHAGVFPPIH